jgi:hypothetical protein
MFAEPYSTTAGQVRTGQIISTPWSRYRLLEVEHVTREQFRSPEGPTLEVVRFTGWEAWHTLDSDEPHVDREGKQVIGGWGQPVGAPIKVHVDPIVRARTEGRGANLAHGVFGALSGRADADQLQAELDAFLVEIGARAAA